MHCQVSYPPLFIRRPSPPNSKKTSPVRLPRRSSFHESSCLQWSYSGLPHSLLRVGRGVGEGVWVVGQGGEGVWVVRGGDVVADDGVGVVTGVALVEVTAAAVQFTAPTPSVKVPLGHARHTRASAS